MSGAVDLASGLGVCLLAAASGLGVRLFVTWCGSPSCVLPCWYTTYPPSTNPSVEQLRHQVPVPNQGRDGTHHINECFVRAVASNDETLMRNTFRSSMNSHAAVLAANASDQLGGEKIDLNAFLHDDTYARFRAKPSN